MGFQKRVFLSFIKKKVALNVEIIKNYVKVRLVTINSIYAQGESLFTSFDRELCSTEIVTGTTRPTQTCCHFW